MGRPVGSKNKPPGEKAVPVKKTKNIIAPKNPWKNLVVGEETDLDVMDDLAKVFLDGTVEKPSYSDILLLQRMGAHMMTGVEVCAILDISGARFDASLALQAAHQRGMEMGRGRIRRLQWKKAENDTVMLIWLGKQYLGQVDKLETKTDDGSKDAARQAFEDKLKSIIDVTPTGEADSVPDPRGSGSRELLLAPVGERQSTGSDEAIVVES